MVGVSRYLLHFLSIQRKPSNGSPHVQTPCRASRASSAPRAAQRRGSLACSTFRRAHGAQAPAATLLANTVALHEALEHVAAREPKVAIRLFPNATTSAKR